MSNMQRCQFCGSHVFQDHQGLGWHDLLSDKNCPKLNLGNHQPYQHAAFYVFDVARKIEKLQEFENAMIVRTGELRIWNRQTQQAYRTTNQIVEVGLFNDDLLSKALNLNRIEFLDEPYFEVIDKQKQIIYKEFCFDDALNKALEINTPNDSEITEIQV